jgi:hypothetical protein
MKDEQEIEMKYQWNETESCIIKSICKQMERKKSFKLNTEAFFGAQLVLRRREVPFYC